jgi:acetylornithine deacetylase
MDLFQLTRTLVDIDSVTGSEQASAEFLRGYLAERGYEAELQPVSEGRANVFARHGAPEVVLSTHMDTVPPFVPSREDAEFIHGRGSCDAKGILAAQVEAAERLRAEGVENFALLFLVGEETLSDGARAANRVPRGSRFIINGEPTENKLALGTKGILRVDIRARGRTAHSAYPHLGESAVEKLLDILSDLRRLPLPRDATLGDATVNIGVISGGTAANVIPGEARAEVLFRTVDDGAALRKAVEDALRGRSEYEFVRQTPAMRLEKLNGFESSVVAFTTDLPSLTAWGRPVLVGPGSIAVAHTDHESIRKSDLVAAVELYARLVRELKHRH